MRFVLVDYMHLAYKCMAMPPLSATVKIDGLLQTVDTTIASGSIKNIYKYSNSGANHVGVFFEGGHSFRKAYFAKSSAEGYKGNRERQSGAFYDGTNLTMSLLNNGGVSLYRADTFEADDLIYSAVLKLKRLYPNVPIDVITGDKDMLPLVDNQVSVYMRGNREFALPGAPTFRLYYQVTPETWTDYLEYASDTRGFLIPYNSMLLFKAIRGDTSDHVPMSLKGYGQRKYTELMRKMLQDGVEFDKVFRYGAEFDVLARHALEPYFSAEDLDSIRYTYNGLNLKGVDINIPTQLDPVRLQQALMPVSIHILR